VLVTNYQSSAKRPPFDQAGQATDLIFETLRDIEAFSSFVLQLPLYPYQLEPLRAIIDSVLHQHGREFLLIFPRQSGKNEAIAHLLVYLLNLLQRRGGQIVYGAVGDALGRGVRRLEERLDNPWNRGRWQRQSRPIRRTLGKAAVTFISSHPRAASRGETAHHLLVIDEAQDQNGPYIESVFTPMRAAHNATAVYLGTVRLTNDFLWAKKQELERETAADGIRRIFFVTPDQVTASNPNYGRFLAAQERRYGRFHPIVAAEYYLEPVNGSGGLFPPERQALMRGRHPRRHDPDPDAIYVATIDVAGQDEAATDPIAQLQNPARDYTAVTIFQIINSQSLISQSLVSQSPIYHATDTFTDHGSRHFQDTAGRPKLAERLLAYLRHWNVIHTVIDASGVGQGLADWLTAALGKSQVTAVNFAGRAQKAMLGSSFLALIETGRFKYWAGDEDTPGSDGWWFWRQVEACTYSLPANGRFERDLRWGVPAQARIHTPAGMELIHDDRLLSAALVVEFEALLAQRKLMIGRAASMVIPPFDPI
jgi:hypothetical protein